MISAMEQLHSLSALDDEGLLTRLGRRVCIAQNTALPLCGYRFRALSMGTVCMWVGLGNKVGVAC